MTALGSRLSGLLRLARQRHAPQQTSLGRGLIVRADCRLPRLCLWREQGEWKPGKAAEREARTCAGALGWTEYTLRWQGRYLVIEQQPSLLS